MNAFAIGREHLFLEAADRQNVAAQRDFARHRDVAADLASEQRRNDARRHCDAGRGAVFRDRAFGQMDVDVVVFVEVLGQVQHVGTAADVRKAGLRRFLHDVAELARQDQLALAFEHGDFRRQDVAADFRPGHARHDADLRLLLGLCFEVFRLAEVVRELLLRDADWRFLAFDDASGGFAADAADQSFELSDA